MNELQNSCKCRDCIFKELISEDLPEVIHICSRKKIRKYLKGTEVVLEGDEISEFIYLKSGLVKLYKHRTGDQDQIISIARPQNFIGLLSVFSEKKYNYSVSAIEDSEICFLDLPAIKTLIRTNGDFALNILEKISRTADDIIKNNLDISRKNLRGRIAYILLHFSNDIYHSESFDLPVSRKEIAELIDMTSENVIRIISEFGKDNILKVKKKQIEILDISKLRKISELG